MSFTVVQGKVDAALKKLRIQDSFLMEACTNERTISHKLAEYLQEEFQGLKVDCEYNRHEMDKKELKVPKDNISWNDLEARTVFPDIVVHRRGTDDCNILVIEIKKSSSIASRQLDENKLIALTRKQYHYRFGLLLEISMNGTNDVLKWYSDGGVLNE